VSAQSAGENVLPQRVGAAVAMVGVLVYAAVDVILQFLPPHYSAISQAESDLAVGPFGWIMAINFFGRGVTCAALILALASGTPRARARDAGLALFAIAGFCSALIAFFPTDIDAPGAGAGATTWHGTVHVVGASTGFVFALAAFWVLTLSRQAATTTVAVRVFLAVATAGLLFLAVTIVWLPAVFGLAERICLVGILGWVFVVARGLGDGRTMEVSGY
jgi:hypothetical membrane protein